MTAPPAPPAAVGAASYPTLAGIRPEVMTVLPAGDPLSSYAGDLLTSADFSSAIDSAATLKLVFADPTRALLNSPLLNQAVTIDTGANPPRQFTLVQVSKTADTISATFEDAIVNKLRGITGQLAAAPGVVTREQFAAQLLRAAGVGAVVGSGEASATVPLTRGTSQAPTEDTWACLTRLAGDVHYRCFSDGRSVWFGPDSWLFAQPIAMTISEFTEPVDYIDFDYDVGKPTATAKVATYAGSWTAPIGARVSVARLAAATGDWLVSGISRGLYLTPTAVTLLKPEPEIPEPAPATTTTTTATASAAGASAPA